MDRYLAGIVLLVLTICSLFLLDDLKLIELPFFTDATPQNHQLVGRVAVIHNKVKRRSQNEFLWAGTKSNENVYFYDSLLTLSESQAILELFEKSRIELSENTLIVIEPSASQELNEIRLRFKHGSLKSRELNQDAKIQAGEWELKLSAETDFHLRTQSEDNYELEIQKGTAEVITNGKVVTVSEKETLILKPESIEKLNMSQKIEWKGHGFKRIYTREERVPILVQWEGHAQTLSHSEKSNSETTIPLLETQQEYALPLNIGTHFFRLRDNQYSSQLLTIELNRAPSIHLFSPLPRDRIEIKTPTLFTWRDTKDVEKFKIEIAKDPEFKSLIKSAITHENFFEYIPDTLGRFYWHVVGIDRDGFEVLPVYSNEILFVENPLSAPGIENLERKPSDLESYYKPSRYFIYSLWHLFISTANADTPPILFEWRRVSGADTYNLEIDDDPYFQSPQVIPQTKNNYYRWTGELSGIVFWRVAGDSKNGRLGLFSAVQKVDLSKLRKSRKPSGDFDVYIKEEPEETLPEAPVVAESNTEQNEEVISTPSVEAGPQFSSASRSQYLGHLEYAFGFGYHMMQSKDIDKVTVIGSLPLNLYGQYDLRISEYNYKIKGDLSLMSWKSDEKKYPFQTKQETLVGSLSMLRTYRKNEVWLGLRLMQAQEPVRLGLESFEFRPVYMLGPTIQRDMNLSKNVTNQISGSLLIGDSLYWGDLDNTVRRKYQVGETSALTFGLKTNISIYQLKEANSISYNGQALLALGFEW